MLFQHLSLAAVAISSVNALPSVAKRDGEWDTNGNIKLTFSEEKVKLGDVSLDEMFKRMQSVCHESGNCETNDITFDGWYMAPGNNAPMGPIVVTMAPSGSYPTWIRNGLVDSLQAAVKAVAKCGTVHNTQLCQGGDKGCSPVKSEAFQCEVPKYWGINYQSPDVVNAAPPFMGADVKMDPADGSGCQDALDAIGAIAGAIHGVGGGLFTLPKLSCGASGF
ncbi:hypothetical protein BCR34DRAFT_11899 [Clohesyomyces aquaticus]|uniref:Uncharacterized protein n=1 Tax=Clohesyomyces aquaticus TaxID=1231657 RepID=A0A1Y1ZE82_9PLEO|nr:hypothetical protein BCR34DRAFT_11899 [Clohesyomyces aquaticus]